MAWMRSMACAKQLHVDYNFFASNRAYNQCDAIGVQAQPKERTRASRFQDDIAKVISATEGHEATVAPDPKKIESVITQDGIKEWHRVQYKPDGLVTVWHAFTTDELPPATLEFSYHKSFVFTKGPGTRKAPRVSKPKELKKTSFVPSPSSLCALPFALTNKPSPPSPCLHAFGRHPTLLKRKKGCDCETKEADNSGEEKVCDRCKKEYCDDGNGDPVWIEKIQKVKEKIDSIVAKADVFMHGYHTCHNENLNMCRTKDTPKDKNLPTFGDRAFLSALRRNLGGKGSTTASVFGELGLNMTGVQQHLDNLDEQEMQNRKRKQIEEVSKLQGKALEAQIILFNLLKTYKGDSTKEGQKKRLAEFVSNPSAFQHYVRPHKPRATPPRCSSSFSAVAAHSPSSAV
ncbi:hypothetical protein QOT17_008571 [Balamuthia mandrillaris]